MSALLATCALIDYEACPLTDLNRRIDCEACLLTDPTGDRIAHTTSYLAYTERHSACDFAAANQNQTDILPSITPHILSHDLF